MSAQLLLVRRLSRGGRDPRSWRSLKKRIQDGRTKQGICSQLFQGKQAPHTRATLFLERVIPRAIAARGICFSFAAGQKQIPRYARNDKHITLDKHYPCSVCSSLSVLCVKSLALLFRRGADVGLRAGMVQAVAEAGVQNAATRVAERNLV